MAAGLGSGRSVRKIRSSIRTPEGSIPTDERWDPGTDWTPWSFQGRSYRGRLTLPPLVLLDKTAGAVTSRTSESGAPTVFDLLPESLRDRVQPVGRLDRDTSGLLLFTGDGRLIQWLGHPRRAIPRTYRARLSAAPEAARIEALREGRLELRDGHAPRPSEIRRIDAAKAEGEVWEVTLTEGKYHEVRRIFGATGVRVLDLVRLSFGPFSREVCRPHGWHRLDEAALTAFYASQGLELPPLEVEVEPVPVLTS